MTNPFQPHETQAVANSTSAASGVLPDTSPRVALYNSSATATAFWVCRVLNSPTDTAPTAVAAVPGTPGAMPIPPGQLIRLTVGHGPKKFSVIASAADGTLYVTAGDGN